VHIELPENLAKHDSNEQPITPRRFYRSHTAPAMVHQAFNMLMQAKRPVILAGNGCIRGRASTALRKLCDKTGIGVISTFMAKGCVDRNAPYCLHTVGLGSKDHSNIALDEADLVLTLGFDMVEYHPSLWNAQRDKRIVHADFLPAEIDQCYHPETELVGDLAAMLDELNRLLQDQHDFPFDLSIQRQVREAMCIELAEYANDDTSGTIRPQKILWDAREVLAADDILISDVGAHKMWIARHYHCNQPNTCLIPNGYCSMGFALPGAIAASLIYPQKRILAIVGDGGFLMNVQEMETARRLNSNIVVMVWEDKGYGLISWKQETEFKRHTDLSFSNPDWLQLAQSFAWKGHVCTESAQLKSTLETAFNESGPSLVVVPVDYRENALLTEKLGRLGKRM